MSKKKPGQDETPTSLADLVAGGESKEVVFLVVDDDAGARQILCDYLRSFGYNNILEAKDGAEALKVLRENTVSFVISDWEMPNTTGLDLLRTLKTDDQFKKIPFIMVTSPISEEKYKIEDAAAADVDGYIIKPFRSQILREKIDRCLSEMNFNGRNGVLVVDDDDDVRQMLVEYIESMGHKPIFQAKDGDEGFAALQLHQSEIAFVVSDWEMPKMAGIDLLRRIRADEKLGSTPFIMVTSQTSIERVKIKQALDADVDNYLLKPFRVQDLKEKVEFVLKKAKEQVSIERDLARGQEYLDSARWSHALKTFTQVIAQDSQNVRAYLGAATAQHHLAPEKAIPRATQFIRKALAVNPRCVQAHLDLALTFESAMSLEKAIACLREALNHCSFSEQIHYHLGRLLLRRGLKAEGYKELQKALELKPDFREAEELLAGKTDEGTRDE